MAEADPATPPTVAAAQLRAFTDSNVWLYALAGGGDPVRQTRAVALLAATDVVVSTQVINEVVNNLLRKFSWPESRVRPMIEAFHARCTVIAHDRDLQLDASRLRERYGFSHYDGLIVAAAARAGVPTLFTEDLHGGLVVRGTLAVVNPFAPPAAGTP